MIICSVVSILYQKCQCGIFQSATVNFITSRVYLFCMLDNTFVYYDKDSLIGHFTWGGYKVDNHSWCYE